MLLEFFLKMEVRSTDSNATGCRIDDPIQTKFFLNQKFCLCAQEYLQNLLSVQIAIIPERLLENGWDLDEVPDAYIIHVLGTHDNQTKIEQAVSDAMKNLFERVQSQTFTDDKGL